VLIAREFLGSKYLVEGTKEGKCRDVPSLYAGEQHPGLSQQAYRIWDTFGQLAYALENPLILFHVTFYPAPPASATHSNSLVSFTVLM